ncbi:zinc finger A20 and AN1 domain-containing stress-associated protein 8-like [Tripterygium wilfordii]|uniref:zinc finger A20 and AN1 domain-containing stress-associated protein 8-like n=1 Tax=Tripterygium wilfordii TaxID=458696 RepID=UPI0018F85776|nr:zinc finger A20 and AN1 domain-containing stress-associated protein 8-like [Tripterygium wilfordii]
MEQESQKRKLEGTTATESMNAPIHCVNNCGFFGSPNTNNLCSKCYKESLLKQPRLQIPPGEENDVVVIVDTKDKVGVDDQIIETSTQNLETKTSEVEGATSGSPEKRPVLNRCSFCRKRVGLTGFKCRCGQTFCSQHRYSDKHNCAFDYKSAGQDAIAKGNPVVKPDKMEKM